MASFVLPAVSVVLSTTLCDASDAPADARVPPRMDRATSATTINPMAHMCSPGYLRSRIWPMRPEALCNRAQRDGNLRIYIGSMQPSDRVNASVLPPRPSRLKSGDVLVSRPTARADLYEVSVVPAVSHASHVRYENGMEAGRQLARSLGVDGWFTCDHTHFMPIARRPDAGPAHSRAFP